MGATQEEAEGSLKANLLLKPCLSMKLEERGLLEALFESKRDPLAIPSPIDAIIAG
jgi:hypothetical protein